VPLENNLTQVHSQRATPTAAILLIGSELLSGRTQDANLAYMAKALAARGIRLSEARVIPDDETVIVDTLNTLRSSNTYVFTTGGIGPTHDDITADCIASAFKVDIGIHPEAKACLLDYWSQRGIEPNEDRLQRGPVIDSVSIKCNLGEGTIAAPLRDLQSRFPDVDLGSYPGGMENSFLSLVARSDNQAQLSEVQQALRKLVEGVGGTVLD